MFYIVIYEYALCHSTLNEKFEAVGSLQYGIFTPPLFHLISVNIVIVQMIVVLFGDYTYILATVDYGSNRNAIPLTNANKFIKGK